MSKECYGFQSKLLVGSGFIDNKSCSENWFSFNVLRRKVPNFRNSLEEITPMFER